MKVLNAGKVRPTYDYNLHTSTKEYDILTFVRDVDGNSYESKRFVPKGISLSNNEYWYKVVDGDARYNAIQNDINQLSENNNIMNQGIAELDEELDNVNSQLTQNTTQIKRNVIDLITPRTLVTFVTDDAALEDRKLEEISREKGIPFVTAIYRNCPNEANLKRLHDELGWEIAGHHQNNLMTYPQTEIAIKAAFEDTINYAKDLGFNIKNHIYANSGHNALIRKIASEYFDCAAQVGGGGGTGSYNKAPLTQYNLYRVSMGSYYAEGEGTDTYYKLKVDQTHTNTGWLIFMLHPEHASHDEIQQTYIRNTIDYIKSLGIDIVTLEQGIEIFGNKQNIGDYYDVNNSDNYYVMGANGEVKNKNKGIDKVHAIEIASINKHTNASLPTEFTIQKVTYTPITATNATGFPENKAGMLETYRLDAYSDGYTYQNYKVHNSTNNYTRHFYNNAWSVWTMEAYKLPLIKTNVAVQTINANSTKDIAITITGAGYNDAVIVNPYVSLEPGLMYSALIESPTTVKLRLTNVTGSAITTSAKDWLVTIIKNT